jgi:hypothetical protein
VACAAFGWLRPLIAVSAISRLWQVGGRVFVRGVFFIWAHGPFIALSRRVAQRADAEGLSSAPPLRRNMPRPPERLSMNAVPPRAWVWRTSSIWAARRSR